MLCPKCGGIEEVIKVHETTDYSSRLCDVQCIKCGKIKYYQPYDFGQTLNIVPNLERIEE